METLKALPDLQGRKYGTIPVGYDRVDQIRMEFGVLETLAALLLGCERDEVTILNVQRLLADISARRQTVTTDDRALVSDLEQADLLALAVEKQRP